MQSHDLCQILTMMGMAAREWIRRLAAQCVWSLLKDFAVHALPLGMPICVSRQRTTVCRRYTYSALIFFWCCDPLFRVYSNLDTTPRSVRLSAKSIARGRKRKVIDMPDEATQRQESLYMWAKSESALMKLAFTDGPIT